MADELLCKAAKEIVVGIGKYGVRFEVIVVSLIVLMQVWVAWKMVAWRLQRYSVVYGCVLVVWVRWLDGWPSRVVY